MAYTIARTVQKVDSNLIYWKEDPNPTFRDQLGNIPKAGEVYLFVFRGDSVWSALWKVYLLIDVTGRKIAEEQ